MIEVEDEPSTYKREQQYIDKPLYNKYFKVRTFTSAATNAGSNFGSSVTSPFSYQLTGFRWEIMINSSTGASPAPFSWMIYTDTFPGFNDLTDGANFVTRPEYVLACGVVTLLPSNRAVRVTGSTSMNRFLTGNISISINIYNPNNETYTLNTMMQYFVKSGYVKVKAL